MNYRGKMVNWAVVVVIVVGLFLFFRISPAVKFGKTWTYITGALILFFTFSFSYVLLRSGGDIFTVDGFITTAKLYVSWLAHFFSTASDITGQAINTDWSANVTK